MRYNIGTCRFDGLKSDFKEFNDLLKDINSWLPKIRKGGMISGHDYFNPCGVKKAVDEKFGSKVKTYDSCWYVEL